MITANTKVQVGTGERGENEFGDPTGGAIDATSPAYPASLIERSRTVMDDADPTPRTVVWAVLRVSPRIAPSLVLNSIVHDVNTGKTWTVEEVVNRGRTTYGTSDVTFNLKTTAPPRG